MNPQDAESLLVFLATALPDWLFGGTNEETSRRLGFLLVNISLARRLILIGFSNIFTAWMNWLLFLPVLLHFNLVVLVEWQQDWPEWLTQLFTAGG